MPGITTVNIGSGKDFANIAAAANYLNDYNCTGTDNILDVVFHNDQTFPSRIQLANNNTDVTRYVRCRPAPGLSFTSTETWPLVKAPTTGLRFHVTDAFGQISWGRGFRPEGIRHTVVNGLTNYGYGSPFTFDNTSGAGFCTFEGTINAAPPANNLAGIVTLFAPWGTPEPDRRFFNDCFIITGQVDGNAPALFILDGWAVERCTIIAANDTGPALRTLTQYGNWTALFRDTVVRGRVDHKTHDTNKPSVNPSLAAACRPNFVTGAVTYPDAPTVSYPPESWTSITGAAFESGGFRPATSSALIGTASTFAQNKNDVMLKNRGPNPDPGAVQRQPTVALPSATITGVLTNGQVVTISGTTTGSPTSGTISLVPATEGNGAVLIDPTAVTLGTNSFTVTFTNVIPGNYSALSVVTVSGIGSSNFSGGAFSISPITGVGQGPDITPVTPPTIVVPPSLRAWRRQGRYRMLSGIN